MKASFFLIILWLPSLLFASSSSGELRDLYETSFSRNNSFCHFGEYRFQLQIRSIDKYTQINDADYGEYPFILQNNSRSKITINNDIGRFRFIYSGENNCSKTLSIPFTKDELTLFYAQDNRPYPDLLVVVYYNPRTQTTRVINSGLPILKYIRLPHLFKFASLIPKTEVSELVFENNKYTHFQVNFPIWKQFDGKSFTTDISETFAKFEWRMFFSSFQEFKEEFQWNQESQSLEITHYEMITNNALHKKCLRIKKQWRCLSF